MGIRPTFYILVGIDDVAENEDGRYKGVDPEWLEEILNYRELTEEECWRSEDGFFDDYHQAKLGVPGETLQLYDKVYNPTNTSEYHLGNVIGYVVNKGPHDDDIIRALCTIDEKYMQSGYERIPTLDPKDHQLMYRHYGYNEHDVKCNRFVNSVFENYPARDDWQRAMHYLKLIGWEVPEEELRYLLVWDWC